MNILVTGGNGQLGRSVGKISTEFHVHTFTLTDLPEADILDSGRMVDLIRSCAADAVINCAAYTAVDSAEENAEAAFRTNRDGAASLAEACARTGSRLIHFSTDYVFPGDGSVPLTEKDKPAPKSVYGQSKLAGEQAIKDSGCTATVIRTSWLYSEFGHNFLRTMLDLSERMDSIGVVADQYGSPTYATGLARTAVRIAARTWKGFRILNYSDEGEASWWEFASEIMLLSGRSTRIDPLTTDQYPAKAPRPAYSVLDKSRIKAAGFFVPDWRDSLRDCLETMGKLAESI